MGYDLHITRRNHWAEKGNDITSEEWLSLVANDPELRLQPENGPYFVVWNGPSSLESYWLDWSSGQIDSKNPVDALINKMVTIAKKLGASVQDDDGEIYRSARDAHRNLKDPRIVQGRHTLWKILGLFILFCVSVFLGGSISREYLNLTASIIIGVAFAIVVTLVWSFTLFRKRYKKIQWASSEQSRNYSEIEKGFFNRVLSDFVKAILFTSDETSLKIYEPNDLEQARRQREEIIKRTLSIYHVDITEVYDGPLFKIFELIKNKQSRTSS